MLNIKLQFFGGRGSGGGHGGGGGAASASIGGASKEAVVNASAWKEGIYSVTENGVTEDVKVEYKTNDMGFVQLYVDGAYSGSEVQIIKNGPDAGKYNAHNMDGEIKITKSANVAAAFAFGSPRNEAGTWKLKKRKVR